MKEVKNFAMRQIIDAEILGINKVDLVEEIRIPIIEASVQQLNPKARVVLLSAKHEDEHWHNFVRLTLGEEAEEIIREAEPAELKTTSPDIQVLDKDTGLPIEMTMDSIEASGVTSYATEYGIASIDTPLARSIGQEAMERIKSEVIQHSPEFVGHIKLFVESETDTVKVNLTAFDKEVTTEVFQTENSKTPRMKILSAVSGIPYDTLVGIVQDTIETKLQANDIRFTHKVPDHGHENDHEH